jgi:hypothetical protein
MPSRKILIILSRPGGYKYLKTREECAEKTLENAKRLGYRVASRNDPGITEPLTETFYLSVESAKAAAESAGYRAFTVQSLRG